MKAQLLLRDGEYDWSKAIPWNADALDGDLSLHTLFTAMAGDDAVILEAVQKVVMAATVSTRETILFRQDVLRECLHHEAAIRELYAIATEAMEREKKHYLGMLARYPHWVLKDALEQMEMFAGLLGRLRKIADQHAGHFTSEGWVSFFGRVQDELNDAYFQTMATHLNALKLRGATLLSAGLDPWSRPAAYVLHDTPAAHRSFWQRLWAYVLPPKPPANSFAIHPRDEAGARALERIHDEGIAFVSVALAQARDHIRDFFAALRLELAFYLGGANLHRALTEKGMPLCFPTPAEGDEPALSFQKLYDASLALAVKGHVVGNDLDADGRDLIVITGANQGGKSTFLRSIGLAQLMMQAGLFVGAEAFRSSLCCGLFTHYKREESAALESGKFDEELARMRDIVDHLAPHALVLFNESFAATNEREGSEVAYQILGGLLDRQVRVICVTHLYDLAHRLYEEHKDNALFLRPERLADGTRTFRLVAGEPLPTSFGTDLYRAIFSNQS